jgi:hypothetical protein
MADRLRRRRDADEPISPTPLMPSNHPLAQSTLPYRGGSTLSFCNAAIDVREVPLWIMSGKAHNEQITSGFPATADIARILLNGRRVPLGDILGSVDGDYLSAAPAAASRGSSDGR